MKALYRDELCVVVQDGGAGVTLEPCEGTEDQRVVVDYGDPDLLLDPTDSDIQDAGFRVASRRHSYAHAKVDR